MNQYIVYNFDASDWDGDQYEIGRLRAKNFDTAIKQVKRKYGITKKDKDIEERDSYPYWEIFTTSYHNAETGDEIEQPDEYDENKHSFVESGIRIEEVEAEQ